MTHETEATFEERVLERLRDAYPEAEIVPQFRFSETGRIPDILLTTTLADWVIEIENDWEAVLKGIGQSLLYASHGDGPVPAVIVPRDHTEEPELSLLRERGVRILEYDPESGEFIGGRI